jgi:hypothetical protein
MNQGKKTVNFYTVTNGREMKNASYYQTMNIRKNYRQSFSTGYLALVKMKMANYSQKS